MTSKSSINNDDDVVVKQVKYTHKKLHLGIQKQFSDYLILKYLKNEDEINLNEQQEFDDVIQAGILIKIQELKSKSTLLHKGKIPRKDVWHRLGSIAGVLLSYSDYPIIHCLSIKNVLNTALGNVCERTFQDYRATLLNYCNKNENEIAIKNDSGLGQINVTGFVSRIPKQYMPTSLTSSLSSEDDESEEKE